MTTGTTPPRARVGPLLVGDKPMPHSPVAERAVLSCILQRPDLMIEMMTKAPSMDVFYVPAHRVLYRELHAIAQHTAASSIDLVVIMDHLQQQGTLEEVGGEEAVMEFFNNYAMPQRFEGYLDSVLESNLRRNLIRMATDVVGRAWEETEDLDDIVGEFERNMASAGQEVSNAQTTSISSILEGAAREITNPDVENGGYSTGIRGIDDYIIGLRKGEVYVLAARPSVGKSALAHNIVSHFGQKVGPVGLVSLEMSAQSIAKRMLAAEALIDPNYFKSERLPNLGEAVERMHTSEIFIEESATGTPSKLLARARTMHLMHKIKFMVVDYLQLFQGSGDKKNSRERDVAELSATCKQIAREMDIPVMVLCQLNRSGAGAPSKPKLSQLRESGSIEQDADTVILLHRKENILDKNVMRRVNSGGAIEVDAIIAKNRNGRCGLTKLFFYPQFTLFRSEEIHYPTQF